MPRACPPGCPTCGGHGIALRQRGSYVPCPRCEGHGCINCDRTGSVWTVGRHPDICPDCLIRARALDPDSGGLTR